MIHICTEVTLPPALGPMDNGPLALCCHVKALVGTPAPRCDIVAVDEDRLAAGLEVSVHMEAIPSHVYFWGMMSVE